ncbi:vanadium-dependent haloperoxidase [Neobacillus sp. 179-C4.2 HS]|uniref:Vanadium-dependent haloperoxidase n=1 Tax=Neobacillus driksii TaxID=3035913 RepID=A0ABV4YTK7_9BACI|nr:vanadium-dependent haloperoxidase [Neobacillus sp. 179.-C4.2 HS]MDP5194003.1 vanadium-dependent haloperoxidase [Neobacillus sp. 179.-C4.2 HS]
MRANYRRWSEYPYLGEVNPPQGSPEPREWPMFFIFREKNNIFLDPFRQPIHWRIKHPNDIDWEKEIPILESVLNSLTPSQRQIALYWGTVEITERISTMTCDLADKYKLGSPDLARVLGCLHASLNDAFIITWYFKYLWDVARPNLYGQNLPAVLKTPHFSSYPSAHATVAGCAEVVLSYFFPEEVSEIKAKMELSAQSRLYAGVHFKVDNDEGLELGRQIGGVVLKVLRAQDVNLR